MSTLGPWLITTLCGAAPPRLRLSLLGLAAISVVLLMTVVLFTITVEGLTGLPKFAASTNTKDGPTTTTPGGPSGAQPQ
jgi:hypothetical protein